MKGPPTVRATILQAEGNPAWISLVLCLELVFARFSVTAGEYERDKLIVFPKLRESL